MLEAVRLMVDYTLWADGRAREAVSKLAAEAFTKDLRSSHGSVRDTAVHLAGGQWMWLSRWEGTSPKAMWEPARYPDAGTLRTAWEEQSGRLSAFAAGETEEGLRREVRYTNTKGESFVFPLWKLMLHLANHSTYHRGQLTTLLRQLGASPVATDLSAFIAQK